MNINKIDNIVVCNRCVMDSTDPNIVFDESGNCNYCNDYLEKDFKYTEDKELQLKK